MEDLVIDRYFLVSSWDWKSKLAPNWKRLNSILKKYEIYHQGDLSALKKINFIKSIKKKQTVHSGSNISDYMKFIVDNYPYFPEELGLVKANLIERHIPKKILIKSIKSKGFVPLYYEKKTLFKKKNFYGKFLFQQIAPGICLEIANNWYARGAQIGKYYPKIEDLFYKITKKKIKMEYIPMIPGANMIVEEKKILRWKKSFYQHLYEISSYQKPPNPMPVEAWHIERLMLYIFYFEIF